MSTVNQIIADLNLLYEKMNDNDPESQKQKDEAIERIALQKARSEMNTWNEAYIHKRDEAMNDALDHDDYDYFLPHPAPLNIEEVDAIEETDDPNPIETDGNSLPQEELDRKYIASFPA